MVHYKLYYFPIRGRAEPIRQLFKIAGTKFEDIHVNFAEWPKMKPKTPLGHLPVLEVDGQQIAETAAILRFLGHQFQRAGKNPLECARLDMVADFIKDMTAHDSFSEWSKILMGGPGDKDDCFKNKVLPTIDQYAPTVDKFLAESGTDLFIGDLETWVDITAAEMFARVQDFGAPNALQKYPHIERLIKRIHETPAIKQYLQTRPAFPA